MNTTVVQAQPSGLAAVWSVPLLSPTTARGAWSLDYTAQSHVELVLGRCYVQRPSGLHVPPSIEPVAGLFSDLINSVADAYSTVSNAAWFLPTHFSVVSPPFGIPVGGLRAIVPGLDETVRCPARRRKRRCSLKQPASGVIVHLNDDHKWTREKIADWLDTLDVDLTVRRKDTDADNDADDDAEATGSYDTWYGDAFVPAGTVAWQQQP